MSLTSKQREFLSSTYNKHLEGKSKSAASLVRQELKNVERSHSEYRGELARQEVVIANAAAREEQLVHAVPLLRDAVSTIIEEYPIGSDKEDVDQRNRRWEVVYGEQNAQVACLRDILHVIENAYGIVREPELLSVAKQIKEVLFSYYGQDPSSFSAIQFVCEEGSWEEAKKAYAGSAELAAKDSQGFIITTARMLGRSLDERDWDIALELFSKLIHIAKENPKQHGTLVVKQIGKNFSNISKRERDEKKRLEWRNEFEKDKSKFDVKLFNILCKIKFVGLGAKHGVTELE